MVYNLAAGRAFSLQEIQDLVLHGDWDYATERAETRALVLEYFDSGVQAVISALRDEDFDGTFAKSAQGRFGAMPADVYLIAYDKENACRGRRGHKDHDHLYIKLSITADPAGRFCAVFSFHLEGAP